MTLCNGWPCDMIYIIISREKDNKCKVLGYGMINRMKTIVLEYGQIDIKKIREREHRYE